MCINLNINYKYYFMIILSKNIKSNNIPIAIFCLFDFNFKNFHDIDQLNTNNF